MRRSIESDTNIDTINFRQSRFPAKPELKPKHVYLFDIQLFCTVM